MTETNINIKHSDLIEKIDNLKNISISSIGLPYQMQINDPQKPELIINYRDYFDNYPQSIPKIIHQVWIGSDTPPWEWINSFRKQFIENYPDWEYHLWREKDIEALELINRDLYDREKVLSGKVNILRYELLYQFGGIYIDADSKWLNKKPLQELIDFTNETGIFAGKEDKVMVANGVIGCSRHNPCMYYVIKLLGNTFEENRSKKDRPTWISSGPRYFSEAILDFGITIFPKHFFYPISWHDDNRGIDTSKFTDSYMIQYGYSTNGMANNNINT